MHTTRIKNDLIDRLNRDVATMQGQVELLKTNDFFDGEVVLVVGCMQSVRGQFGFDGSDDMAWYDLEDSRVDRVFVADGIQFACDRLWDNVSYGELNIVFDNRGPTGVNYLYKAVPSEHPDYVFDLIRLPVSNFFSTLTFVEN